MQIKKADNKNRNLNYIDGKRNDTYNLNTSLKENFNTTCVLWLDSSIP